MKRNKRSHLTATTIRGAREGEGTRMGGSRRSYSYRQDRSNENDENGEVFDDDVVEEGDDET